MNLVFEKLGMEHQKSVMEIFNYYITTGTAAFPPTPLPEQFYPMLIKRSEGLCAYAVIEEETNKIIGFCSLNPYSPFPTFQSTATVSYFIAQEYTAKGIGTKCLQLLEKEGKALGIRQFIAEISSENESSVRFHKNHGFVKTGELKNIGEKLGRRFGVVFMQKSI